MNFSSSIYGIFSTLTPREGSGFSKRLTCYIQHDFNSRSSRGERWLLFQEVFLSAQFQFSLPAWGAICAGFPDRSHCNNFNSRSLCGERYVTRQSNNDIIVISILAPCVGSARNVLPDTRDESDFNSRSPHGERRA